MEAVDEDALLREVALKNAASILQARQRAEAQLLETQDALKESRERLQAALIAGGLGTFRWDIARDAVDSDEQLERMFGLETDSRDRKFADFIGRIHPDDLENIEEQFERTLSGGADFAVEFRVVWPDGSVHWIDDKGTVIKTASGIPAYLVGACLDITARKQSEEALRESAERLHAIFHQAAVGIAVANLDGCFVDMNEKFASVLGYSPDELRGLTFTDITHPDDVDRAHANVRALLAGEIPDFVYEKRYIRKDGEAVWSRTTVTTLKDADGQAQRYIGVIEDITARKAAETDNARLYESAQLAAEEREKLLQSERFARAQAEHMSAMKDEFLATLSHELRTPLSAILGWSQVLRHAPPNEADLVRGLDTIERNARVQQQLIEDLLDMSRITSGKLRLEIQSVSPAVFVEAALETIRHAASAKGIRIEQVLDPAAGPISGDPNRLQQVTWNLLSNAIKFTPRGGKVQVVLQRVNSHIEISVADTGSGIDAAFLPHVFERFRQADATITRQQGGLGLGLSIVRHLMELHGGSVRITSPGEGLGTTVTLQLPVKIVHAAETSDRTHPRTPPRTAPDFPVVRLDDVSVLVVEDHPDARELVQRVLVECGANVLVAGTAAEALSAVEQHHPHILVSDIGMPDVDGYELLSRIRALGASRGGSLPAIALTAFARSEDRTRALRAGFQAHLSKPVEASELVAMIASVTGHSDKDA